MKKADRVFGFIGLGLSLWCLLESTKFNYMLEFTPGPGFMPFWVGVILGVLSCYLLYDTFRREPAGEDEKTVLPRKDALYRVGFIFLMLFGVMLAMPYLGFPLTVFLFVAAILLVLERYSLVKGIFYGVAYCVVIWVVFVYFMKMGFPKGFPGI